MAVQFLRNPIDESSDPELSQSSFPARRAENQAARVNFARSLYQHFTLPEIAQIAAQVEKSDKALRYFPGNAYLEFSAAGDRGSYCESGWRNLYVELKFSGEKSSGSGRETIPLPNGRVSAAVKRYLDSLATPDRADDDTDWR